LENLKTCQDCQKKTPYRRDPVSFSRGIKVCQSRPLFSKFRIICPFHSSQGYCDHKQVGGRYMRRTHGRGKAYCREVVCPFRFEPKKEFD
jgi:hypothetical protein